MYKRFLFLSIFMLGNLWINAQSFTTVSNIFTSRYNSPTDHFIADLNGDGDQDILISCNNMILWYENTDGQGTFGPQQLITDTVKGAKSVYASDLDGDGDLDVLSASLWDNTIAWYENLDGQGTFGDQQVISTAADGAISVNSSDVDGDGDQDVLSASLWDHKVAWYPNTDAQGTFGPQQVITISSKNPGFIQPADLDSDSDMDVVSASYGDKRIAWYKNTLSLEITKNPEDTTVSPDADATMEVKVLSATVYQWQVDTGNGFSDLTNNTTYSGVDSDILQISGTTLDMSDASYRCVVSAQNDTLVSGSAILKVRDAQAPTITSLPEKQVVGAEDDCQCKLPDYTGQVEVTDNHDDNPDITQNPIPGTKIAPSIVDVVITAIDNAGNSSQATFPVEVKDLSPPAVTYKPSDQTINATEDCQGALPDYTSILNASDNCYGAYELEVSQSPKPLTLISDTANEVSLTVTDPKGNDTTVFFYVDVVEEVKPTIECPEDQLIQLDEGQSAYTVSGTEWDPDSVSDNCSIARITNDYNNDSTLSGAQITNDTTSIVWSVMDQSGNQAQCSFEVILKAPVTGLNALKEYGINLYPNPARTKVYFASGRFPVNHVKISDFTGKILMERSGLKKQGSLDVSGLEAGIYLVTLTTPQKVFTIKMVKE